MTVRKLVRKLVYTRENWKSRIEILIREGLKEKEEWRDCSSIERMGLISIHPFYGLSHVPHQLFPPFLSSRSGEHHPPPSVWIPPALSADRPGSYSARDAMPEATAGSSGKSFLQRARGKVLRWLRRSLRTTHQVNTLSHPLKGRSSQFLSRSRFDRINYLLRKQNLCIPPAVLLQLFSKNAFALSVTVVQWSIT